MTRNLEKVLLEAIVIGVIAIFFGYAGYFIMSGKIINSQEKYFIPMIINIFLIGFLMHVTFEYTGLNESWCRTTFT